MIDHDGQAGISLIIPSYNRAPLIKETIDAALAQHTPFLEIIVVDDGSTDDTLTVLAQFGERIRVIALARGGVQAARNTGVQAARGRYITLCDSDDLLEPAFVDAALGCFESHPEVDAFYCNFVTFDPNGTHPDKFSLAPPDFFAGSRREGDLLLDVPDLYVRTVGFQPLFISGCAVRKSFYQRIGGFDTAMNNIGGEDWEFTLRALSQGRVAVCTTPLARIRKHASNQSGDTIRQVRGTARILEHALDNHAGASQHREAIQRSIDYRRVDVFNTAYARGNFEVANEMLGLLRKKPTQFKFRLKTLIAKLPPALRLPLWRLTQQ